MVEYLQKTFTIKFMKDQPFPLAEKKGISNKPAIVLSCGHPDY